MTLRSLPVPDGLEGMRLDAGLALHDAFYRWARDAVAETHSWPAASPPGSQPGVEAQARVVQP